MSLVFFMIIYILLTVAHIFVANFSDNFREANYSDTSIQIFSYISIAVFVVSLLAWFLMISSAGNMGYKNFKKISELEEENQNMLNN